MNVEIEITVDWQLSPEGEPEVLLLLPGLATTIRIKPEGAQKLIEDLMRAKADSLFAATMMSRRPR